MITLLLLLQVNLAQGKPATASSEESGKGNLAGKAVDGNPDTRWCAANGSFPQWWKDIVWQPGGGVLAPLN